MATSLIILVICCLHLTIISAQPPNDHPCNAQVVTIGETIINIDLSTSTAQPGEISPGAGTAPATSCNSQDGWCSFETGVDNSVWYQISAYVLEIESSGSGDSQLAVYVTTDCNDFSKYTEIAANDDGGVVFNAKIEEIGLCSGDDEIDEIFLVQLDGYNGNPGPFSLEFRGEEIIPSVEITSNDANNCWIRDLDEPLVLDATLSNGSPEYFSWISTDGTLTLQPNTMTTYSVTITDSFGCEWTDDITITPIGDLSVNFAETCTTRFINTGSDTPTAISAIVSGGSGQFDYEWNSIPSDATTIISDDTLITSTMTTTTYSVTVKDTVCDIEAQATYIVHVEDISCSTSSSSSEEPTIFDGLLYCEVPCNPCAQPKCVSTDHIFKFTAENPFSAQGPCENACNEPVSCDLIDSQRSESGDSSDFSDISEAIKIFGLNDENNVKEYAKESKQINVQISVSNNGFIYICIFVIGILMIVLIAYVIKNKTKKISRLPK